MGEAYTFITSQFKEIPNRICYLPQHLVLTKSETSARPSPYTPVALKKCSCYPSLSDHQREETTFAMRLFPITMALTGYLFIAETAFIELGASNVSCHEVLTQKSSAMILNNSQFEPSKAKPKDGFDKPVNTDRFQEIKFLEEKLELILEEMKSFIHAKLFDSAGFHLQADSLFSQLTNIRDLAEVTLSPLQSTLQGTVFARIRYVTSVFFLLVDSAEILEFYSAENGPAQKMVARLIILNLKLMRLFDSQGQPVSSRCNYVETVARLATRKKELEDKFGGFKVPSRLRRVFDFYSAQADASLSTLAETIPHFEI